VVTHRMLLREVWGPNAVEQVQYLRVYMGQIRRKLKTDDDAFDCIATESGVGYRLLLWRVAGETKRGAGKNKQTFAGRRHNQQAVFFAKTAWLVLRLSPMVSAWTTEHSRRPGSTSPLGALCKPTAGQSWCNSTECNDRQGP